MARQRQKKQTEPELVALIATALSFGVPAGTLANRLAPQIGIPVRTLTVILVLASSKPWVYGTRSPRPGAAFSVSDAAERVFRAEYVLAASRRYSAALAGGVEPAAALADERRYFELHLRAMEGRRKTAVKVDQAAARYGATLGWHAILDSRTSPECRMAHGRNFNVGERPAIGYPGSVHPSCRCRPGKPFNTSNTVYTVKPERRTA